MTPQTKHAVLGIVGSPRRHGNTEILVGEVLRGAADAGAATDQVFLAGMRIAPCLGCDQCADTHVCIQKDDMALMREKMAQAGIWVLGTPVYWWGATAQFKAFLDRWYAGPRSFFKGKRIILAIPLGDDDPATARHTVGMFEDALDYVDAELFETLVAAGVNDLGEIRDHSEMLAAAYQAGRRAVGA
jgi:putative NADPH-quinone reductase